MTRKMPEKKDWIKKELEKKYINRMTAVTIPVNIHIEGRQRILDLSEVKRILRDVKMIALGGCTCRTRLKKCDAPFDVCTSLDDVAEYMVKKGFAKKATLEQALEALERSHEAGLVQLAYVLKGVEKPHYICSCCSCCCHSTSALVRIGMPEAIGHIVASEHIAVNSPETCTNCGTCVERCQFKARLLDNGKLVYNEAKCFGCGICVSTCPTNSISLVKRN